MWNLSTSDCKFNKACKIDEYLDIKNWSCEERLTGKLVLECEDEILSTTKTSLDDKKGSCKKNNCLIYTTSLVIVCLLLVAVASVGCHIYYTRDWIKKEHSYHIDIE